MPMARKIYRRNKKGNRKQRRRRAASQQIYNFKRTVTLRDSSGNAQLITASTATDGTKVNIRGGYVVSLQDFAEYTDFTGLFQQYKINKARIDFIPSGNQAEAVVAGTNGYYPGVFQSIIDRDDNITPAFESEMDTSPTLKKTMGTRIHSRTWRPSMLREIYNGEEATAFEVASARWLSTAFPEVPHYGLKIYCPAPQIALGLSAAASYTVRMTLWFSCKNLQ